jgi:hypothetical protein
LQQQQQQLYDLSAWDVQYGSNIAQYLVDLHDHGATFDFCGGMMFQLVLSDALQTHLRQVASNSECASCSHMLSHIRSIIYCDNHPKADTHRHHKKPMPTPFRVACIGCYDCSIDSTVVIIFDNQLQ